MQNNLGVLTPEGKTQIGGRDTVFKFTIDRNSKVNLEAGGYDASIHLKAEGKEILHSNKSLYVELPAGNYAFSVECNRPYRIKYSAEAIDSVRLAPKTREWKRLKIGNSIKAVGHANSYLWTADGKLYELANDECKELKLKHIKGVYTSGNRIFALQVDYDKGKLLEKRGQEWTSLGLNVRVTDKHIGNRIAVNPYEQKHLLFGSWFEELWESLDGGKTWKQVETDTNSVKGIGITGIAFDPKIRGLVHCCAYGGRIWVSHNHGTEWEKLPGSPLHGESLQVDPLKVIEGETLWTLKEGSWVARAREPEEIKSVITDSCEVESLEVQNGRLVIKEVGKELETDAILTGARVIRTSKLDPNSALAIKDGIAYRTSNRGETWEPIPYAPEDRGDTLPFLDTTDAEVFYLYSNNQVFRSKDRGKTFSLACNKLPILRKPKFVPTREAVWGVFDFQGLFVSRDKCERFERVTGISRAIALCQGEALAPNEPPALYICGTANQQEGVHLSRNGGLSWMQIASSPEEPTCIAHMNNKLYVGTRQDGIYFIDLD